MSPLDADPEIAEWCGQAFADRLAIAARSEQESRDLLLELMAEKYKGIRSKRSRLKWAALVWLKHRWGTL